MSSIGPYRLLQRLGICQVGQVWWAVDAAGNYVSLAVLDPAVARDDRWRQSFANGAHALAPPRATIVQLASSDLTAPAPWVACVADPGPGAAQIFVSLGQAYQADPVDPGGAAPADGAGGAAAHPPAGPVTSVPSPPFAANGGPDEPFEEATRRIRPHSGNPWAEGPTQVHPAHSGGGLASSGGVPAVPGPALAPNPMPNLGNRSWPVEDVFPPVSGVPVSGVPVSGVPRPVSGMPRSVSAPPPISGRPQHDPGMSAPPSPNGVDRYGLATEWESAAPPSTRYPPIGSGVRRRSRLPLVFGVLATVLLLVGGAGGMYWFVLRDDRGATGTRPTSTPSTVAAAESQGPPAQPGQEPPKSGQWPASWPKFGGNTPTKAMKNLPGLGLNFNVPSGWDCAEGFRNATAAKYTCQAPVDGGDAIGGDVIVRTCSSPCDSDRRITMRKAEEAWGLQWIRDGGYATWAETNKVNGADRYALVFVAFWRSKAEGAIDRQLVFRMTAPPEKADDVRRVANSLRDKLR